MGTRTRNYLLGVYISQAVPVVHACITFFRIFNASCRRITSACSTGCMAVCRCRCRCRPFFVSPYGLFCLFVRFRSSFTSIAYPSTRCRYRYIAYQAGSIYNTCMELCTPTRNIRRNSCERAWQSANRLSPLTYSYCCTTAVLTLSPRIVSKNVEKLPVHFLVFLARRRVGHITTAPFGYYIPVCITSTVYTNARLISKYSICRILVYFQTCPPTFEKPRARTSPTLGYKQRPDRFFCLWLSFITICSEQLS